jgi:F-type H+-transporting ATPase subunit delta
MHDVRVAKRYARALFETALDSKDDKMVAAVEDDLGGIVSLLVNNLQFRTRMLSPQESRDAKLGLVDRLFSDRVTSLTLQALRLMIEKNREDEIEWVHREFARLRREHENKIFVVVTSSENLTGEQQNAVIHKLESATGKKIEAEYKVDPQLIGGVRVAYDNYVLDGSLRGDLRKLRDHLMHDILKQS